MVKHPFPRTDKRTAENKGPIRSAIMPSNTYMEAMRTLLVIRRRLADQFAKEIVRHSTALTSSTLASDDPIGSVPELKSLCLGMNRIQNAIANLRMAGSARSPRRATSPSASAASSDTQTHAHSAERVFDQVRGLVNQDRYEEASRVLSRLLHMPVDRAFTATRFFARALQNDSCVFDQIMRLSRDIETMPPQQVMRTFVHAFGMQAVESGTAMTALRERRRALAGGVSIAPTLATALIAAAPQP